VYYVAVKKTYLARVILHDIRSSYNVGSIFRTADALGIDTMYLTGFTPAPRDQFGRDNKEICKVALGGEKSVQWKSLKSVTSIIKKLKAEGYVVVAVEQHPRATDYKNFKVRRPTVFIFGNEVLGISEKIISLCDEVVSIDMRGKKESLNVSVAFGIALARILNL